MQHTLKTSTILLTILLMISMSFSYFAIFGWLGLLFLNSFSSGVLIAIPVWLITIFSWVVYDQYKTDVLHKPSTLTHISHIIDIDELDHDLPK